MITRERWQAEAERFIEVMRANGQGLRYEAYWAWVWVWGADGEPEFTYPDWNLEACWYGWCLKLKETA